MASTREVVRLIVALRRQTADDRNHPEL